MSPGGLLPHLFTFADIVGCYFLSHYSAVSDSLPLASMVLCVARTFLLCHKDTGDKPWHCVLFLNAKVNKNGGTDN